MGDAGGRGGEAASLRRPGTRDGGWTGSEGRAAGFGRLTATGAGRLQLMRYGWEWGKQQEWLYKSAMWLTPVQECGRARFMGLVRLPTGDDKGAATRGCFDTSSGSVFWPVRSDAV